MVGKRVAMMMAAVAMTACTSAEPEEAASGSSEDEIVGITTKCNELSDVPEMRIERRDADGGNVHLRVGVMEANGEAKADVLFLHGFADRFDNHIPLFEAWRDAGLRVIAFDYPSHGETCGNGIDRYKINGVAKLASEVVRTKHSEDRPLLVAGWSTGGLLAVRMLQSPEIGSLGRVAGAFLLAPGVDVRFVVGEMQFVTEDTLTRDPNPPHRGAISPKSPLATPVFATDLLLNSKISREEKYPKDVPTYVVTGGEKDDVYVSTSGVKKWVEARQKEGARVYGLGCETGRHELDNEVAPIREDVRGSAASFATWVLSGADGKPSVSTKACKPY